MPAQLSVPKPSEIRDAILRVIRTGLIRRGVAKPNVTITSDYYVTAEALAQQLAILYANTQVAADQQMPDTADGDDLIRIADIYNVEARDAQGSHGNIVFRTSVAAFVAIGLQLIDGQGQSYEVATGGTYVDGDEIPIESISTGTGVNLPQGTPLQWVGPPPTGADATVLVAIGGLIDGAAADTTEPLRNRIFDALRTPPGGGNAIQIIKWSNDSSASVQAAYVYPAINGPATLGLCVLGPLTFDVTNGWSRGVSDAVLATATGYVSGRLPEGVLPGLVAMTTKDTGGPVPNVDADVAIGLALPVSVSGGGPGGGWVDPKPWPDLSAAATHAHVSVVTDSTHITLTSDDPTFCPNTTNLDLGVTEVCWFSSTLFAAGFDPVVVAVVTAVAGSTGSLDVTLSAPFTGVVVGDFVFPNAENVQAYARAFMAAMNNLGPGQWTTHPQVLIHGSRLPLVQSSNPSDLTPALLRAITDSGVEVADIDYLYRNVSSPGTPPTTTADPPYVLVPRRVGFYDKIL